MLSYLILPRHVAVCLAIVLILPCAAPAMAGDKPVAIVEDTNGSVPGVAALDLLRAGRKIVLPPKATMIVSYLDSCRRENIRGGTITIGTEQSTVDNGEIVREQLACDPVALALSPEQANQSAAIVFRQPDKIAGDPIAERAAFMMDTRRPLLVAPGIAVAQIVDLRHPERRWSVRLKDGVAELGVGQKPLDAGGVYEVSADGRKVIFRIGKDATDAPLKLLKRIIRLAS
ncbi:hypothetical protein [Dongia sp.]|uniref:hypothetical protein n=1 Tax=Dongia sp. TaxID=1977262 RepID=UPI0035B2432B